MAGHGGGGGGKKGGLKLPSNGCLRYVVLYIIALILLITGLIATSGGLLQGLGLPAAGTGGTGEITIASNNPSNTSNASTASNSGSTTANLPANSGGSSPANNSAEVSSSQDTAAAPDQIITGNPVMSNQAGIITPYLSPAFHIVEAGDTLELLALKYGTTVAMIRSYNLLGDTAIFIGQVLYLPSATSQPMPNTGRNAGE